MEDRQPPRLHLELVREPDHVEERAAAVAAAGWPVSVWEPATTSDDALPRTLPRCDGVVIGEGDGGTGRAAFASEHGGAPGSLPPALTGLVFGGADHRNPPGPHLGEAGGVRTGAP